jgi:dihydrofolate reductase
VAQEPHTPGQRVSLIVAMDPNRVIGNEGKLPWHLPAELQRFKALTMGHHLIMGRKTWQSIGRPLPGRTSIVLTRDPAYRAPGALVATSLEAALALAAPDAEPFIIGGAQVFRDALPLAHRIYLTRVQREYHGDVFFPTLALDEWSCAHHEAHEAQGELPAWELRVCDRKRA